MKTTGLGARLEARFRPEWHWGGEFLEGRVRFCGLRESAGTTLPAVTFEGTHAEAEAFARSRGLAYEGVHAAVTHLPFKLAPLETASGEGDEDIHPQAERLRPQGLPLEALDLQVFSQDARRFLVMAREDGLGAFRQSLAESLRGWWGLTASPLALLPLLEDLEIPGIRAALLVEAKHTHVIFLRDGSLEAYVKVFTGWEDAGREPAAFLREMKKALVYHFGSRFPGLSVEAIEIWKDGPEGQVRSALEGLGVPILSPQWPPEVAAVPEAFRVAAALAWQGLQGTPAAGFSIPGNPRAEARRQWLRRTGVLTRTGYQAFIGLAAGVALLSLAAFGLRWAVAIKTRVWAGELKKWDQFQERKSAVESRLGGLQGILSRRTEAYAGLQRIAALLPPEVWLESWEAEAGPGKSFTHRLTGYTLVESRVPELLSNLEKGRPSGSVKLKSTEKIKAETVEKKTGIAANHKDLIKFQMGVNE